jgi:hypothetical protein
LTTLNPGIQPRLRFSGHESFACRYAWLPKAFRALEAKPDLFTDDAFAMLELGIGKNMVTSLRFWVEVMDVAQPQNRRGSLVLTDFARELFAENGLDPYIEDTRTQWLLHWKLSSHREGGPFAWDYLIGRWPYPEFTRSEALGAFQRESERLGWTHSEVTLAQHLDVFLHTYLSNRGSALGVEDSLDGPLVDLNFLLIIGERKADSGRWELVYGFRREAKPEISPVLFDYCVMDFWQRFSPQETTLPLRSIASAPCSPGQVFKLNEDDVRTRLEEQHHQNYQPVYRYQPSAVQGLLTRLPHAPEINLRQVYDGGALYA